jgi:hypothetical protein
LGPPKACTERWWLVARVPAAAAALASPGPPELASVKFGVVWVLSSGACAIVAMMASRPFEALLRVGRDSSEQGGEGSAWSRSGRGSKSKREVANGDGVCRASERAAGENLERLRARRRGESACVYARARAGEEVRRRESLTGSSLRRASVRVACYCPSECVCECVLLWYVYAKACAGGRQRERRRPDGRAASEVDAEAKPSAGKLDPRGSFAVGGRASLWASGLSAQCRSGLRLLLLLLLLMLLLCCRGCCCCRRCRPLLMMMDDSAPSAQRPRVPFGSLRPLRHGVRRESRAGRSFGLRLLSQETSAPT